MAKEYDVPALRRAIIHRVFLTEIWFNYVRGAALSDLVERFDGLTDSEQRTKGAVRYQLRMLEEAGMLERWQRDAPPPTRFFRTTPRGREEWLNMHALSLDILPEPCKSSGRRVTDDEAGEDEPDPAKRDADPATEG